MERVQGDFEYKRIDSKFLIIKQQRVYIYTHSHRYIFLLLKAVSKFTNETWIF